MTHTPGCIAHLYSDGVAMVPVCSAVRLMHLAKLALAKVTNKLDGDTGKLLWIHNGLDGTCVDDPLVHKLGHVRPKVMGSSLLVPTRAYAPTTHNTHTHPLPYTGARQT